MMAGALNEGHHQSHIPNQHLDPQPQTRNPIHMAWMIIESAWRDAEDPARDRVSGA